MSALSHLPNVGKVLESNLLQVGIKTPEQLRDMGAEEAFIRIRAYVDQGACLHMLYGIQGAIEGVPDKLLEDSTKQRLRKFYKTLYGKDIYECQ
ncbi:TfoX/Sxy family protein [Desulfosporosinus youngiae]|uniref:TfoX C-terminal domain-containing protein n=1 Tax=Desulfosporosinus youngiae DSM 17734 TaxID=768710 RepID=H5XW04_9FIRM|nr:TfoX/Sxy family protein [Desulfosporosinus youngiae]EHQ90456.1 TfoX C-terminal domain-containing protein [Desulfosporosinus youngiae DSM 17734]